MWTLLEEWRSAEQGLRRVVRDAEASYLSILKQHGQLLQKLETTMDDVNRQFASSYAEFEKEKEVLHALSRDIADLHIVIAAAKDTFSETAPMYEDARVGLADLGSRVANVQKDIGLVVKNQEEGLTRHDHLLRRLETMVDEVNRQLSSENAEFEKEREVLQALSSDVADLHIVIAAAKKILYETAPMYEDDRGRLGDLGSRIGDVQTDIRRVVEKQEEGLTRHDHFFQRLEATVDDVNRQLSSGYADFENEREVLHALSSSIADLHIVIAAARETFYETAPMYEDARARLTDLEDRVGNVYKDFRTVIEEQAEENHNIPLLMNNAPSSGHTDRADYALYSAGARVMLSLTSATKGTWPSSSRVLGLIIDEEIGMGNPPEMALDPSTHAGSCWPIHGSRGSLGVSLAQRIYVEGFSIDHISGEESVHGLSSAPRDMEVWGLVEGTVNIEKVGKWGQGGSTDEYPGVLRGTSTQGGTTEYPEVLQGGGTWIRLSRFTYDISVGRQVQTFAIDSEVAGLRVEFGVMVLIIESNWGGGVTCLYRFRVHGRRFYFDSTY